MVASRREGFVKQARECLKNGQYHEAASFAEQAAELDPKDASAWLILGAALSKADRPDEAGDAFRQALALDPTSARAHYNLGVHFYRFGWKKESMVEARKALDLEGAYQPARKLIERIEKEGQTPAARVFNPTAPLVAPPVFESGPSRMAPAWATQEFYLPESNTPAHAMPFIESLGAAWTPILVLCVLGCALLALLSANQELCRWAWMLTAALMLLDLLDRRPKWSAVGLAMLALLFLAPPESSPVGSAVSQLWGDAAATAKLVPPIGVALFGVYLLASRMKLG